MALAAKFLMLNAESCCQPGTLGPMCIHAAMLYVVICWSSYLMLLSESHLQLADPLVKMQRWAQ